MDYDSLPPNVRARLLYSNRKIGFYANSNESVLDVVKNVIKKLNIQLTNKILKDMLK